MITLCVEDVEFDEKIVSIDTWYDRHTKLWVIQKLNKDGYQVGDAEYVYGKQSAMKEAEYLKKEFNV